jgi:hypothetical protein
VGRRKRRRGSGGGALGCCGRDLRSVWGIERTWEAPEVGFEGNRAWQAGMRMTKETGVQGSRIIRAGI